MKDFFMIPRRGKVAEPLRVDGTATEMTPAPDDAELAAEALLESMSEPKNGNHKVQSTKPKAQSEVRDVAYYKELSERIRAGRAAEARLTMRYLAYCEEQLALPVPLYNGQIGEMERELYKRQAVAEREGGELLRRWQHALAEVIVRQMSAAGSQVDNDTETQDSDTHLIIR